MSFTKNWYRDVDDDYKRKVDTAQGHPVYRENADIILEEVDSGDLKTNKYRIIRVSSAAEAKGYYKYYDGGNAGVKYVGDVNRLMEDNPDLAIYRIDERGEGRFMKLTEFQYTTD